MTASAKPVRIKRTTGETVEVQVADAQHYEVTVHAPESASDEDFYARYLTVRADRAPDAKRVARQHLEPGETADVARKIDRATVAVMILHGAEVLS